MNALQDGLQGDPSVGGLGLLLAPESGSQGEEEEDMDRTVLGQPPRAIVGVLGSLSGQLRGGPLHDQTHTHLPNSPTLPTLG